MKNRMRTSTRLAGLVTALLMLILAYGCSNQSPISPSSDQSSTGEFNKLTQVEFASHVATTDHATRTLTFTDNSEVVIAAAGAEIVFKDGGSETPITFEEILVGDSVEVRGDRQPDSTILADRIRVRPEDNGNPDTEVAGRIDTIDPDLRTITLVGSAMLINVLPNAEVTNHDSQTQIHLSEIMSGDSVEIRGVVQTDGSLSADRVRLRNDGVNEFYDVEFKDRIATIDYMTGQFTVEGRSEVILVDENTSIFGELDNSDGFFAKRGDDDDDEDDVSNNVPLAFTDLQVGDSVEVKANIVDPNTLYAVQIELEDFNDNDVEFKAVLATVDANNRIVTFDGLSYNGQVDADAILLGHNNETLTLADFTAGEIVEVKGFPGEGDDFLIVHMHKENNLALINNVEQRNWLESLTSASGKVNGLSRAESTFRLADEGVTVHISDDTKLQTIPGRAMIPFNFDQIELGKKVTAYGEMDNHGSLRAVLVTIESTPQNNTFSYAK